jgi:hypothetical protein
VPDSVEAGLEEQQAAKGDRVESDVDKGATPPYRLLGTSMR